MTGLNGKLAVLVLTVGCVSAVAQNTNVPMAGSPGCGDPTIKFNVKKSAGQAPAKPDAGEALIYIIEDDSDFHSITKFTTRAGVDGKWVGATHGDSFFYFSVAPGVHHLCAGWQSPVSGPFASGLTGMSAAQRNESSANRFTAQAGGVYYFVVKNTLINPDDSPGTLKIELKQVENDEGQLLANSRPVAFSKLK